MNEFSKALYEDSLRIAERDYPKTVQWIKDRLDQGVSYNDIVLHLSQQVPADLRYILHCALKALA